METNVTKRLERDRVPPPCDEVAKFAANLLIKTGRLIKDEEMVRIGQARLRILEKRATAEDFELLHLDPNSENI